MNEPQCHCRPRASVIEVGCWEASRLIYWSLTVVSSVVPNEYTQLHSFLSEWRVALSQVVTQNNGFSSWRADGSRALSSRDRFRIDYLLWRIHSVASCIGPCWFAHTWWALKNEKTPQFFKRIDKSDRSSNTCYLCAHDENPRISLPFATQSYLSIKFPVLVCCWHQPFQLKTTVGCSTHIRICTRHSVMFGICKSNGLFGIRHQHFHQIPHQSSLCCRKKASLKGWHQFLQVWVPSQTFWIVALEDRNKTLRFQLQSLLSMSPKLNFTT